MNHPQSNVGLSSLQIDEDELSGSILNLFSPPVSKLISKNSIISKKLFIFIHLVESHMYKGKTVTIQPIVPLSDQGPIEFQINSSNQEYLYMPMTRYSNNNF